MTNRIQKLRALSTSAVPSISTERARLYTEAYKKYEGTVSVPELRALCLLYYMQHRELYFGDSELIVGEKTAFPQCAPTFPELCCHTVDDLNVMAQREFISFASSADDRDFHRDEVIPFWEKRQLRTRIISSMTDEWRDCYHAGIFTEFMEQRGPGHTVSSENIFIKGFAEYKNEIAQSIGKLDFLRDPDARRKLEQLRAMDICCDAIIILGDRYAVLASEMAAVEQDETRKRELTAIADVCAVIPRHAPRTYWQAIQMYWFVHLCVTSELNPWDAYSPGRLDQHLYPYYKSDIESGALDDDGALELLECLWVKFNNQPAPPKVGITLKESGTYTDFANINTGGITKDGADGVNEVSYLILDCMDEMKLLQPSSNVQISAKTPRKFLLRACEIARKGWGQPAFYNTEAIVSELLAAGKSLEDARKGGTSGCVETGAFGNEAYILTGYFNIPKIFELTLFDGYDHVSCKQIGLHTGRAVDFATFDKLWDAFSAQMNHFLDIKIKGNAVIESIYSDYMPAPFLSVITNDCISTGKDYNSGGARYNTTYIQGVGIGTITDSLSAVKYHVFDEKTISMTKMTQAILANFEGEFEFLRTKIVRDTPFYGNDDDRADALMSDVFNLYCGAVTGRPNVRGGTYRINMLPTTCHVYFGEVMMASANGRRKGKPVSEGISPDKGADKNGPTAVIASASKMDQLKTGGTLLNQKFSPSALAGESGLARLGDLIRAYFAMDGHHIQFNVIDRQTLVEAQKNPESNPNLIVRVAGYSDHFRNLSKSLQDEIIERTENR